MRILAVVLLVLVVAVPARAASVDVVPTDEAEVVRFRAAPGEANRVVARVHSEDRVVVLTDRRAPVSAGAGCRPVTLHRVRCAVDSGFYGNVVSVHAADGDDRIRDALADSDVGFEATGGPGRDVLRGGPGEDVLSDGPGRDVVTGGAGDDSLFSTDRGRRSDDRFDGGPGADSVSYSTRDAPVRGSLRDGVAGVDGERDRLRSVAGLWGGHGDDVLRGGDGDDELHGLGGADRLHGAGGDDRLDPGEGNHNRVFAGPGDDLVDQSDQDFTGRAAIHCGRGADRVRLTDPGFFVGPDCERVVDAASEIPFPAQPLRSTRRVVVMRLPCSDAGRPVPVQLLAKARVVARGTLSEGRPRQRCRVRLRRTARLRRPAVVHLRYGYVEPRWSFVLRP